MSRFTVTIESDRTDTGTMVIHLDTTSGTPRVLEITMAAAAGGSLSTLPFSELALDRLVSAFATEASPTTSTRESAPPAAAPAATEVSAELREPTAARAPATRTRKAAAAKPAQARRSAKTATSPGGTERHYRRMPDATELIGAYHEAKNVTELAAQYEVPRHTMNGWLTRLRRQGLIAPRKDARAKS